MLLPLVQRLERRMLRRNGYRSRHVDTSVGRVHLLEHPGDPTQPPLVVMHGICSSGVEFREVLQRLRSQLPARCSIKGYCSWNSRIKRTRARSTLGESTTVLDQLRDST